MLNVPLHAEASHVSGQKSGPGIESDARPDDSLLHLATSPLSGRESEPEEEFLALFHFLVDRLTVRQISSNLSYFSLCTDFPRAKGELLRMHQLAVIGSFLFPSLGAANLLPASNPAPFVEVRLLFSCRGARFIFL